jgi:hypothetical protein
MARPDGVPELALGCGRYADFSELVTIAGDFSASTFAAQVRVEPNAGGASLATMGVTTPVFSSGLTSFTLSIPRATMTGLPANTDDPSADTVLFYDLVMITGSARRLLLAGTFTVIGGVTQP